MRRLFPPLVSVAVLAALYLSFVVAPTEREMGDVQRILYFHVGSFWVAYAAFFTVAGASAVFLGTRAPTADHLAHASAEVGVLFCTFGLVFGSLWARPI